MSLTRVVEVLESRDAIPEERFLQLRVVAESTSFHEYSTSAQRTQLKNILVNVSNRSVLFTLDRLTITSDDFLGDVLRLGADASEDVLDVSNGHVYICAANVKNARRAQIS